MVPLAIFTARGGQRCTRWRRDIPEVRLAERGGFEPPERFNPFNGLANRRFRPLSHLSTPRFQQPVFIDANAPPVKPNAFRLPELGCDWKWVRSCRLKPAFRPQWNAGFS